MSATQLSWNRGSYSLHGYPVPTLASDSIQSLRRSTNRTQDSNRLNRIQLLDWVRLSSDRNVIELTNLVSRKNPWERGTELTNHNAQSNRMERSHSELLTTTTGFICMTIEAHTLLQKLFLGIKITTQGNYVRNIKASRNIFYELYIDKVIRRVHQLIDQTVYR